MTHFPRNKGFNLSNFFSEELHSISIVILVNTIVLRLKKPIFINLWIRKVKISTNVHRETCLKLDLQKEN